MRHVWCWHWTCQWSTNRNGEEAIRGDAVDRVEIVVDVRFGLGLRYRWRQRLYRRWRWHLTLRFGCNLAVGRVQRTESFMRSLDGLVRFLWQLDIPTHRHRMQYSQSPAGTQPAFSNFFQVFKTMDKVSCGILVREIEEVYRTCGVRYIDNNVAYLT